MTVRPDWIHGWDVREGAPRSLWRRLTPPQLLLGSFAALVLAGTIGLKVLPGLYTTAPLSWLDALFTATSAVCVTGLIVVDTATHFTGWGQLYLLFLIQLGGLGMITFATLVILALGRRLSLRHETMARPGIEISERVSPRRLTYDIVRFTLSLEAAGALVLYLLWAPRFGWAGAVWPAVFHAISAFCNAGFSTFTDSVMGFRESPATLLAMAALIIAGGLGFLVLEEVKLHRRAARRGRAARLSLHTRIVLLTTAVLLAGGSVLFAAFEWRGALGGMGLVDRVTNAFFMSTTARTAGFNAIDYTRAGDDANFLTILLMSIGGSPGSAAGGLKTTTFALIGLLAWSRLRGQEVVSFRGRSVPEETIQRAVGLFALAFGVVTAAIFLYSYTELGEVAHGGKPFLDHMFEAVSAFNTVGLSLGVTPELSTAGRWLTIILMYVGRVGPLALASALARRAGRGGSFRYSYEEVVIG
ncbi:MAG TPA: TrkH family potassium uptake protein [Longimicrobiales bacterium]|nr:TrkH family potassium uptake protein [Longimicrobiales bacterium]